jgi:hypothetical protein
MISSIIVSTVIQSFQTPVRLIPFQYKQALARSTVFLKIPQRFQNHHLINEIVLSFW